MIRTQADLERENIRVAWSMAPMMTDEQYEQLCRVTVQSWRRESEPAVRGSGFESAGAVA